MQIENIYNIQNNIKYSSEYFEGHAHENLELNFVLSGSLVITSGNKVFELHENDILFTNSYVFHSAVYHGNDKTIVMNIQFVSKDFKEKYTDSNAYFTLDKTGSLLLQAFLSELPHLDEKNSDSLYGSHISISSIKILEVLLSRLTPNDFMNNTLTLKSAYIYNAAVNYMKENIKNTPTLDDISDHVGYSKTGLRNIFTKYTGKSVMEYFNEIQMQNAKDLILSGKKATEIADEFGFSSLSYFSQKFKNTLGYTISHCQNGMKSKK